MTNQIPEETLDLYADAEIPSNDARVPWWLKLTYISLPIWGIATWLIFWNGSVQNFDHGYWAELQSAANTTYPFTDHDLSEKAAREASQPVSD